MATVLAIALPKETTETTVPLDIRLKLLDPDSGRGPLSRYLPTLRWNYVKWRKHGLLSQPTWYALL